MRSDLYEERFHDSSKKVKELVMMGTFTAFMEA